MEDRGGARRRILLFQLGSLRIWDRRTSTSIIFFVKPNFKKNQQNLIYFNKMKKFRQNDVKIAIANETSRTIRIVILKDLLQRGFR